MHTPPLHVSAVSHRKMLYLLSGRSRLLGRSLCNQPGVCSNRCHVANHTLFNTNHSACY